jgi:hypothetical protein
VGVSGTLLRWFNFEMKGNGGVSGHGYGMGCQNQCCLGENPTMKWDGTHLACVFTLCYIKTRQQDVLTKKIKFVYTFFFT